MKGILRRSNRFCRIVLCAFIPSFIAVQPVLAGCNDRIGSLEYYQPAMERRWKQLQAQTNFPWGKASVYDTLEDNKIRLSAAFDTLNASQKRQAIEFIGFDYGEDTLRELLTPTEKQKQSRGDVLPGGAMSPYQVVTQEGRLVYTAFDGCTPMILLSERERYSYYTLRRPSLKLPNGDRESVEETALRNGGNPFWRNIKVPISKEKEKRLRLLFWETVGYSQAAKGWWIAWVPELGQFEINVPPGYNKPGLNQFLSIAPSTYPYSVLESQR